MNVLSQWRKNFLKYPDITRAAYDPDYKKAMDEKLS